MKSFLVAGVMVVASALGIRDHVYSQDQINHGLAGTKVVSDPAKSHRVGYAAINPKAMRDFRKHFAHANNEIWAKSKNGCMAFFTSDDIRYKVEYDNKGNWYATQRSYAEKKLQRDVRAIIKRVYFDYTINWITEITAPEDFAGPVYVIQIQDEKSCKSIYLYEGEMRTIDEFSKIR
jgi:hypothetical protein